MSTIDRVLFLSENKGVSHAFICKQLGLDRSWLRTVKKQNSNISDDRLAQIAAILNTTVAYLKGETDDSSPENKKSPSTTDGLTDKETAMLQLFRSASPEFQERYLSLLEVALKESATVQ